MSRLAQEIPQEIIQKAWEAGANRQYEFGDCSSLTFDAMTRALAAVLPDLQRPLLEEIEQLKKLLDEWKQICRYVDYWLRDAGIDRDSCGLAEGVKILAEQRDARPDLTVEEMRRILPKLGDDLLTARAKLERSLNAHKP